MNEVLRDYLRNFVLLFFDDILIFSKSWPQHLNDLHLVFQLLRTHHLYLKRSNCSFGLTQVAYLDHIITATRVTVDPGKIEAILQWPPPRNIAAIRGFLGLASYYHKFIHNYEPLAAPLSNLLCCNAFQWNDATETSFRTLKRPLASASVLQLPDFEDVFVTECVASGSGFGAVLQKSKHPIAYFSRQLAFHHHKLPAYERELIGLAKA
ncbi:uncharacterized mitochondrial protein AtMg00860-like [Aristolochia californica]|uniref:uncharacterized mitochondrial protein AtMg00860-like n=1 Tax=Aristolochia californica TaxID=171875 RepID=UPI0035D57E1B